MYSPKFQHTCLHEPLWVLFYDRWSKHHFIFFLSFLSFILTLKSLTPHMQSPDSSATKSMGKLLGPGLGDLEQGSFSIALWKRAFRDAFTRLCPLRAGDHECGCLPILAKLVPSFFFLPFSCTYM